MTSQSALLYYAQQADSDIRESRFFGLNDPSVAGLRAFIRYHKDARVDMELGGKLRSLTHKQMAMAGAVARISVTQEHATITSIAKEANCAPSTASRFILKLQAWHAYAIDVTRGRHGGVRIRLRGVRDGLHGYAERAWQRIRLAAEKALSRTKRNVASPSLEEEGEGSWVPVPNVVPMDATFNEAWDAAERAGRLLAEQGRAYTPPPLAREAGEVDYERVDAWVADAIHEIRVLNAGEPDWDVYLDKVRASYGMN